MLLPSGGRQRRCFRGRRGDNVRGAAREHHLWQQLQMQKNDGIELAVFVGLSLRS